MASIEIEIADAPGRGLDAEAVRALTSAVQDLYAGHASRPQVSIETIERDLYWEDGDDALEGVYPVFVAIERERLPTGGDLQAESQQLSTLIAEALGRSHTDVHILFIPLLRESRELT